MLVTATLRVGSERTEHASRARRGGVTPTHLWMAAGFRARCGRRDLGFGESRDCLTVRVPGLLPRLGLARNGDHSCVPAWLLRLPGGR